MTGSARAIVEMGAVEVAERIRAGALTSVELITACLDHIEHTGNELQAWVHVDRDASLGQAKEMDSLRQRGLPLGALHGVPVAVDELFGAKGMPAKRAPGLLREFAWKRDAGRGGAAEGSRCGGHRQNPARPDRFFRRRPPRSTRAM